MSNVKTKKKTVAVLILLMISLNVISQENGSTEYKRYGGRGFISAGIYSADVSEMNSALENLGYPTFSGNMLMLGGSAYGVFNRFIIGGEGESLISPKKENDNYSLALTGGYGLIKVGYMLFRPKSFELYPLLGFGAGALGVNIHEEGTPGNFNDFIANPEMGTGLWNGGLLADFGLKMNFLIGSDKDTNHGSACIIGLNAGYTMKVVDFGWFSYNGELSGGPDLDLSGPYVKLVIGFGIWANKL